MLKRMIQRERTPAWNREKLVGQKPPLRLKDIWAIPVRLQMTERWRDMALFNLAIDSKLRACDLVKLRVQDVCHATRVMPRASILQQKTNRPVQFEIAEQSRPVRQFRVGLENGGLRCRSICFPAVFARPATYPLDSTRAC